MLKYRITPTPAGVRVHVTEAAGSEEELLDALQECREGRCACPTPEYDKLASIHVSTVPGTIQIDLETKPGAELAVDAVRQCLDLSVGRLKRPPD